MLEFTVTHDDTAIAVGSGDVPALATPRLLAWLEAATMVAAAGRINPDSTTVGTFVSLEHRRASAVGSVVRVEVTGVEDRGRGLAFDVIATDAEGHLLAAGQVLRAVVDRQRFLDRLT